jgi:PBP1b-binding outer membrane lipoprotein LpoB
MLSIAPIDPSQTTGDLTIPDALPNTTQAIVDTLNANSNRVFKLTIISTVIISVAALMNTYRLLKQLRRDEAFLKKTLAKRGK